MEIHIDGKLEGGRVQKPGLPELCTDVKSHNSALSA